MRHPLTEACLHGIVAIVAVGFLMHRAFRSGCVGEGLVLGRLRTDGLSQAVVIPRCDQYVLTYPFLWFGVGWVIRGTGDGKHLHFTFSLLSSHRCAGMEISCMH